MAKAAQCKNERRALLGTVFAIVFLLFNAAMLGWLPANWGAIGGGLSGASEVERAGAAIDATATTAIILLIWVLGAGVTGLLALLTRR